MIALALVAPPALAQRAMLGDGGVSAFYHWDRPVPAAGRVLRREPLPAAMLPAAAARGVRILYASTTDFGGARAIAVSGTVLLPKGRAPRGGWPVVAWAHGTTGTADVCAPSWTGYRDQDADVLNGWLAAGYAVASVFAERPHPSALLKQDVSILENDLSRYRRYPTPRFAMPVFLGIGRHDSATAPELSFNVARAACAEGARLTVRFYDKATHTTVVPPAQPDILAFAAAAMAGRPLPGNCAGLTWPGRGT